MSEQRRHRLIWIAVGCVHLAALAGVAASGSLLSGGAEASVGGLILVRLDAEPLGLPGEVKQGLALGGGSRAILTEAAAITRSAVPEVIDSNVTPALPVAALASAGTGTAAPTDVPAPLFVPPQFRVRTEPAYPERARRAGVEGRVTVRLHLSASGEVLTAQVAVSSGSDSLDAAALQAAQASRFTPARIGEGFIPSDATATYRFELK
ncbi:MAG: TonB family protein [Verrucomicrobia bacterium]|nr:TonB family protein [Verrucomicrobiota bacterium]